MRATLLPRLTRQQRKALRGDAERHKKLHWSSKEYDLQCNTYVKRRNLEFFRTHGGPDVAVHIRQILPKKGKLTVLDSGAGYLKLSADLKHLFGKRIFVTALTPVNPKVPQTVLAELNTQIRRLQKQPLSFNREAALSDLRSHLRDLKGAERAAKLVDELKTGMAEELETQRRYNLILDFSGPAQHSSLPGLVVGKYFTILKPFGEVILECNRIAEIKRIVETNFGPSSKMAQRSGFYLSITQHPKWRSSYLVTKLPIQHSSR